MKKILTSLMISLLFSVNADEKKHIGVYEKVTGEENAKTELITPGAGGFAESGDVTQEKESQTGKWIFDFEKPMNSYFIIRIKKNDGKKVNEIIKRCSFSPSKKHTIVLKRALFSKESLIMAPGGKRKKKKDYYDRYHIRNEHSDVSLALRGWIERPFNDKEEFEKDIISVNQFGKNIKFKIKEEIELYRFFQKGKDFFISFSIKFKE